VREGYLPVVEWSREEVGGVTCKEPQEPKQSPPADPIRETFKGEGSMGKPWPRVRGG
jgi:hypothetical protein